MIKWIRTSKLSIKNSLFNPKPQTQALSAMFRLVSNRHETDDRFEVSDVVSFKKKPKPKPAFGAGADERKTGLRFLKGKIGRSVMDQMLPDDHHSVKIHKGGPVRPQTLNPEPGYRP